MKLFTWIGYAVAQLIGLFLFTMGVWAYAQGVEGVMFVLPIGAVILLASVGLLAAAIRSTVTS